MKRAIMIPSDTIRAMTEHCPEYVNDIAGQLGLTRYELREAANAGRLRLFIDDAHADMASGSDANSVVITEKQLADLRANAEHLRESLHVQDNQVDFEVASNQLHTVYEIVDAFNAKSENDADSKTKPVLYVEPDRFLKGE